MIVWVIQDEGVGVDIGDKGDQGDVPEIHMGALPTFEDCVCQDCDCGGMCVIEVDFVLVIDGCVARHCKFAGAEEQVADQRRDKVDLVGRSMYVVMELVIVVAGVTALFGRWNTGGDMHPVGRDEFNARKALDVAPVSLTPDGTVPFRTHMRIAASGLT